MKIKINKTIGNVAFQFEIDKEKEMDAMFMAGFLAATPDRCSCGSTDVQLNSNRAKGFDFVKIICSACGKRAQLGQYKDGGFFWKDWEEYNPEPKE